MSTTPMKTFAEDFRALVEQGAAQLQELSEADSVISRAKGKWSPKEILGHLIDSAANNHSRFVRAQFTSDLSFDGYDQEEWVRVQGYRNEPWTQLVQLWRSYNLHLAHLMSTVSDDILNRPRSEHNLDQIAWQPVHKETPATLDYFMRDYVGHLLNHLRQILENSFRAN